VHRVSTGWRRCETPALGWQRRRARARRPVKKRRHDTARTEAEACRAGVGGCSSSLPLGTAGQGRSGLTLELRETRRNLCEVPEPGRAFGQVPLKPAHRRLLVLRRSALRVELHELQGILERQVRQLAGCVLREPECSALDRTAEADLGVRVRRSTNICSHRHRIESGDTAGADRFPVEHFHDAPCDPPDSFHVRPPCLNEGLSGRRQKVRQPGLDWRPSFPLPRGRTGPGPAIRQELIPCPSSDRGRRKGRTKRWPSRITSVQGGGLLPAGGIIRRWHTEHRARSMRVTVA
jgi:hypothetical protein